MVEALRMFIVLLGLAGFAAPALAANAPMSEQEMTDKSDLVALVRVLSVTCTSVKPDEQTGQDLPGYIAKLQVVEVKKGDAKPGDVVLVAWRAIPKDADGPWTVYYYPGEEVVTHLVKRSGGVTYASTWLNAKSEILKSPDVKELPTTPGNTAFPPDEPKPQTPL